HAYPGARCRACAVARRVASRHSTRSTPSPSLVRRLTWWGRGQRVSATCCRRCRGVLKSRLAPGGTRREARLCAVPGREPLPSCTANEFGNGARLDHYALVLRKLGRIAIRWSRPVKGTSKTVPIINEAAAGTGARVRRCPPWHCGTVPLSVCAPLCGSDVGSPRASHPPAWRTTPGHGLSP